RMMAKRPEDRFGSYDELLDALAEVAPDRTRPAGLVARAIACAIDAMLVGFAAALITVGLKALGGRFDVFPILAAIYGILAPARTGATYGKRALEIEIACEGRRGGIGLRRALRRFALQWGPTYLLGYGVRLSGLIMPDGLALEIFQNAGAIVAGALPLVL